MFECIHGPKADQIWVLLFMVAMSQSCVWCDVLLLSGLFRLCVNIVLRAADCKVQKKVCDTFGITHFSVLIVT